MPKVTLLKNLSIWDIFPKQKHLLLQHLVWYGAFMYRKRQHFLQLLSFWQ